MSYCSNCGGRLNDNGLCPNCGSVSKTKITPEENEVTEVAACLKALFSASPLNGVEKAARTRSASVWVTFGALYIVTTIMAQVCFFTSMPPTALHGMLDKNMAHIMEIAGTGASPEKVMPAFASIVGYSAVMSLLSLILISITTSLLFLPAKEKPSFSQAMNISTFSTLPVSVCALLSLPISLLSVPLAAAVLLPGLAMASIMYYFGVQKASEYDRSPFWFFVIAMFVGELVLWSLSMIFTMLIF